MDQERTSEVTRANGLLQVVAEVARELHPHLTAPVTLDSLLGRELGFDSLGRVELVARIERTFGVVLPDQLLLTAETPRDFLLALSAATPDTAGPDTQGSAHRMAAEARSEASIPVRAETLIEVLAWHAAHDSDRCHIRFYSDTDDGAILTYGELARGAAGVAATLRELGLQPGGAVAIMLPTGPDYFPAFFGALLAGGIPVPMYPPTRPTQLEDHLRRQAGILANSMAAIMITFPEATRAASMLKALSPALRHVMTMADQGSHTAPYLPAVSADAIALLQYTSGSTGNPKGVALTHRNLLANVRAMGAAVAATPADVFVSWLPLYHDMGLIGAWLGSLYHAMPLVLMPPLAFLARPQRWLQAIQRHGGTLSAAPNFAYDLCLRRIDEAAAAHLELGTWRAVFNGAEPINPDIMQRFMARFAPSGLRPEAMMPVYGLAECSVGLAFPPPGRGPVIDQVRREPFITRGEAEPAPADDPTALRFVACGHPLPGHQVRIANEGDRELPERREGRVQFRGPSATSGYYRNPDANRILFHGEWLDSGDLGYLANGELHLTGRTKDIIIRAGRNLHPDELEAAVGDLPGIRRGNVAVFASRDPNAGTERLVLVAETRESDPSAREELRRAITALGDDLLGLPPDEVVLAPPNTVLKTSSGKIRRAACRRLYEEGDIGRSRPPAWRQLAALRLAAAGARWYRARAAMATDLFAASAWFMAIAVSLAAWLAVLLLPRGWRWGFLRRGLRLLAALTGTRLTAQGLDRLPQPHQPCIYVANHASYLDAMALIALLPREVAFVAKKELAAHWFLRLPLTQVGTLFVERFETGRSIADAHAMVAAAEAGRSLFFFPEGGFTRITGLAPFHMGAFMVAAEVGLPMIPVAIRGTRSILRADSAFPRRGSITVVIGELVLPGTGDNWQSAGALRDAARSHILRYCGEPDLAPPLRQEPQKR